MKILRPLPILLPSLSPEEKEATYHLTKQKQARRALRGECLPGIIIYLVERARGVDEHGSYIAYSVHKITTAGIMRDITELVSQAATTENSSWDLMQYGSGDESVALVCYNVAPIVIGQRISTAIWGAGVIDNYDIQVL